MQQQKGHKSRHVKWDEQKLKETQKFRGMFQKIDEPKTPYRANQQSDEEMEPELKSPEELALDASLQKAKNNSSNPHKKVNIAELNARLKEQMERYGTGNEMEDEEEEQAQRRRQEFKKKRASHYNQFQMIRKMKQEHWSDEDD